MTLRNKCFDSIKPTCAICEKEVDNLEAWTNPSMNKVQFIAKCHGQEQIVDIENFLIVFSKIEPGLAFYNQMYSLGGHSEKIVKEE